MSERSRWTDDRIDDLAARTPSQAELAALATRLEDLGGQIDRNRKSEAEEHEKIHQRITRTRDEARADNERIRTTIRNTLAGLGAPVVATIALRVLGIA